jgi:hypothetical protein
MDTTQVDAKELCVRATHIMADGTLEDFEAVVHPDARNREDVDEPPASRGRGPLGLLRHRALAAQRLRRVALGYSRHRRRR